MMKENQINTPLISVLIPTYQQGEYLKTAIESVYQKPLIKYLISFLFSFAIMLLLMGLATIGGVLGTAIFERRPKQADAEISLEAEV